MDILSLTKVTSSFILTLIERDDGQKNKFWRRQQMARVFKARMILYAAYGHCIIREDGSYYEHPRWFELAKEKWAQVYKTTGTPCSCWMCRGLEYNRKEYKKKLCVYSGINGVFKGIGTKSVH